MTTPALRLTAAGPPRTRPALDDVQRRAADHPVGAGHLVVVGAPGTGKTTTAVAAFEKRLASAVDGETIFLAATRLAAARIRDDVSARSGRTVGRVAVRTPASMAFTVLRARAALLGEPVPTLVTGPEQDVVLGELLAGHLDGVGTAPQWPDRIPATARALPAFRQELRDVLMRAAEAGLGATGLAELGRAHGRSEWVAAADVLREYHHVLRLGQLTPDRGERLDAASIVDEAVAALAAWPAGPGPRVSTVVVDDLQDATLATARLLRALADAGAELLLFGDADAGVHGFRGGTPALVGAAAGGPAQPGGFAATRLVLPTAWRQTAALRAVTAAVTAGLPAAAGARHRRAPGRHPEPPNGRVGAEVSVLRTRAQEAAYVARVLREEHLRQGTPYSEMAVVVRGGEHAESMRRALASAGVPVASALGEGPLRDAPAVRPLLLAMEVALDGSRLTPETAAALLGSPLAGGHRLDAVSLRALRRALRGEAAMGGDARPGEDLVLDVLGDPGRCARLPTRIRRGPTRIATVLAAGRRAAGEPGATAETVLWAVWSAADLAEPWRRAALAGGSVGERADRDLDAACEVFRAAEQFTERNPAARPAEFLAYLRGQALPGDSLAPRGVLGATVEVLTPAGAAGSEWDVVAVAGVQEDVWPDLRVRDSLLGAHELADLAAGRSIGAPRDVWRARHEVLADELRAFVVAVSRARRRLVVTAVRDAELSPSPFLDIVDPGREPDAVRPIAALAEPLDLRGLVARLRAELPDGPDASAAADILARLAARDVPGADPDTWSEALEDSTAEPLWRESEVAVSPSAVEAALECPLRWALERTGGRPAAGSARSLGNLVHAIAAAHPHGTEAELMAELDRRWPDLGRGDGWPARHERRLAEAMVRRLAGYLAGRPGPVETEVAIEATIGRARVSGRIDRVEHGTDGAVRLVDIKTGRSCATDVSADPQLGVYQAAVRAGALGDRAHPAGASIVAVGVGARAAERRQAALDGTWAEDLVAEVVRTATSATFLATVGDGCRSCPVRTSCPAQPDGDRVSA